MDDIHNHNIPLNQSISLKNCVSVQRDGMHIYVAPDVPAWIVTSPDEATILEGLLTGQTPQQILMKFVDAGRTEESYFNVLVPLLQKLFSQNFIANSPNNPILAKRKLGMYITDSCNLTCKHCYLSTKNKGESLSLDLAKSFIDQAIQKDVDDIVFLGAEPTRHKDFLEMLKYAKDKGMTTTVLTNGSFSRDPEYIRVLVNNADTIQISLDGASAAIHEWIRGKNTFEKTIEAIKLLDEYGAHQLILASIVFKENANDFLENIETLLQKINVPSIQVIPEKGMDLEYIKLTQCEDEVIERIKDKIVSAGYTTVRTEFFLYKKRSCGFAEDIIIRPNGDVSYCIELDKTVFANVHTTSMTAVIEKLDKEVEQYSVEAMKRCRICELQYICGGPCRVLDKAFFEQPESSPCEIKDNIYKRMLAGV